MFGLFKKDPIKKLEKEYNDKLVEARDVLRQGDVKANARLMAEAEKINDKITALKKEKT